MRKRHPMIGAKPQCPHCEAIALRRQARTGFWQTSILSRFGYFPWECGQCRQLYMLKQRSTGYRQHAPGVESPPELERMTLDKHN